MRKFSGQLAKKKRNSGPALAVSAFKVGSVRTR
jgi:hypothetical protein